MLVQKDGASYRARPRGASTPTTTNTQYEHHDEHHLAQRPGRCLVVLVVRFCDELTRARASHHIMTHIDKECL